MPPETTPKKLLMIVDGHAVLHRAWHALPPLSTRTGQVVSGAYGFVTTLLNSIKKFQPTHLAVTFDLKEPTFRHRAYEAYKAGREKQPEDFYAQIPIIEKILQALNVQVFTAAGFEADDVIATLTEKAGSQDKTAEVVIVTGDLDTLQLVNERVRVYTMRRGLTDTVIYDIQGVADRFSLRPDQMVDYKALRGDPSDNIPGVKGIGEVTASELLVKFGTLDALYAAIDRNDQLAQDLRPSVREKLIAGRKDALQARELCRLRRDAPIDFLLDKSKFQLVPRSRVASVFEEYQFVKLLQQFPEDSLLPAASASGEQPVSAAVPPRSPTTDHQPPTTGPKAAPPSPSAVAAKTEPPIMIHNAAELADALTRLGKSRRVAFRTATKTDDPLVPGLITLGFSDGRHTYLANAKTVEAAKPALASFFADKKSRRQLVCHDLKRETNVFISAGLTPGGSFFDLMIASYLFFSGQRRHSLGSLLTFYRGLPADIKSMTPAEKTSRLGEELPHLTGLAAEMEKQLASYRLTGLYRDIELPLAPVLARMERLGIAVDVPYLKDLSKDFRHKIGDLEEVVCGLAGEKFNINSPRQVKTILFEKLALSPVGVKKTAKGRTLSTAASELEKLRGSHPIVDAILAYRELAKLKSTYVDVLPELVHSRTGRIHADFNQAVTATGRLSSSNPNLQNIPTSETEYGRLVRDAFVAAPGCVFLSADYSQIELRLVAHLAGEKAMIKAFKKGEDIHWRTAVEMWGEAEAVGKRRVAKVINFGILYGMGPQRLAEEAGISTNEARDFIDRYFAVYPGLGAYIQNSKDKLRQDGYAQTLFGRRRFFYNYEAMNHREKAEAERQAVNMPIQGTSADMIKLAMVRLDGYIRATYGDPDKAPVKLLSQVHDELIFEVREDLLKVTAKEVVRIMENVKKFSVPIVVNASFGGRWGSLKKMEG